MKMRDASHDLETRAAAALKAVLAEVSTIKVREIRHESTETGLNRNFTAHVEVFGHRHTLACAVQSDGQPVNLRTALENGAGIGQPPAGITRVIIAPYLSPEAQALCKANEAGFLDLEGNARLTLGEVFIVKRTLPHQDQAQPASSWHPGARTATQRTSAHRTRTQQASAQQAHA
jgi:hypothetical protein